MIDCVQDCLVLGVTIDSIQWWTELSTEGHNFRHCTVEYTFIQCQHFAFTGLVSTQKNCPFCAVSAAGQTINAYTGQQILRCVFGIEQRILCDGKPQWTICGEEGVGDPIADNMKY